MMTRWRTCSRYHRCLRPTKCPPILDESHSTLHTEHIGRALGRKPLRIQIPHCDHVFTHRRQMLMVCHHLDKSIPEDLAVADTRIRAETVAAEDVFHDNGAITMISSDSQAMGRVGEVISRTWRTASKMKEFRGPLADLGDRDGVDNGRVKRYIAKYTVNP